jgi:hypothetical protein
MPLNFRYSQPFVTGGALGSSSVRVGEMIAFGSGMSAASTAVAAAKEASAQALTTLRGQTPKLAIVFASVGYDDVDHAARAVRSVVGDAQIVGGTSGGSVFAGDKVAPRGVSVVLVGGDDLEVEARTAPLGAHPYVETVPAAERGAQAADRAAQHGFCHFACLVFAPGTSVDGDALVAAVRKGAGARAQLAGALTGDEFTMDRSKVLFGDELSDDCVVITGIFTKKPVGIAARHGWQAVGPVRTVTRAEGTILFELDGRPAAEVWVEDARLAGASPPEDPKELALYLANHYELGLADDSVPRIAVADDTRELVVRAPWSIHADGAIRLSASISDGTHVRVLHATRSDLLRASSEAAASAVQRAGGRVSGALVLACSGRLAVLDDSFADEPAGIRLAVDAPIGGACVFGEIARNLRDTDAFFNTTAVVVAFA